jgi:hypothetical protein
LSTLNEKHVEDGYVRVVNGEEISEVCKAYADDILLFSSSFEGLQRILDTAEEYFKFAGIEKNPKKSEAMYVPGREVSDEPHNIKIGGQEISYLNLDEAIKYLGAPFAAKANAKRRLAEEKISKIEKIISRLSTSGLNVNQILHAIKTFVVPKLDYVFLTGLARKKSLRKLDLKIRKLVNSAVEGHALPVDIFYTNWRDGGLSLTNFVERANILTLSALSHMLGSNDKRTSNLAFSDIKEEATRRNIATSKKNQNFLNWCESDDGCLIPANGRRYDSLPFRAYKAVKRLMIKFHVVD